MTLCGPDWDPLVWKAETVSDARMQELLSRHATRSAVPSPHPSRPLSPMAQRASDPLPPCPSGLSSGSSG